MRLTRTHIIVSLTVILPALLAICINIVTNKPFLPVWLAWVLLVLCLGSLIIVTLKARSGEDTSEQIESGQLDYYMQEVIKAEESAGNNPGLQQTTSSPGELEEWEILDLRLLRSIKANKQQGWRLTRTNEPTARLVLRLTKVLVSTLQQSERLRILSSLVIPTYKIALALKAWGEAALLAYEIATTLNDDGTPTKADSWANYMEKCIEKIHSNASSLNELHAKLYDIQGVILKYHDIHAARKKLEEALRYSRRADLPLLTWRVATHLGALEKDGRARKFTRATELYEEALECIEKYEQNLDPTEQSVNPDLKLSCYQELGELALLQGNTDQAHARYTRQLELASSPRHIFYRGGAYRGLAEALFKKDPHNAQQAYQMARSALDIEQEIVGNRKISLLELLIQIADILLLQQVN